MARYNVRDLLGHWVKPRSKQEKMCPHACCRNKRVHPENFPVILPPQLLHRATDDELAQHYGKHDSDRVRNQVLREMERRDDARVRRENASSRRAARKMEHEAEVERSILEAERATNGYMLNKKGRARGISERSLFTGSEQRAQRYASDELLEHWRTHPRPTRTYLSQGSTYTRRRREVSLLHSYGNLY